MAQGQPPFGEWNTTSQQRALKAALGYVGHFGGMTPLDLFAFAVAQQAVELARRVDAKAAAGQCVPLVDGALWDITENMATTVHDAAANWIRLFEGTPE